MKKYIDRFFPGYSKALVLLIIGLALFTGYWLRGAPEDRRTPDLDRQVASRKSTAGPEVEPGGLYACPMMCISPRETPGNCPICGMELVYLPGHDHDDGRPRLTLSEDAIRLAEIQTATVERKFVNADIRAFGQIVLDTYSSPLVFPPLPIAKLYVYESDFIWLRHGQPITFETDTYPGQTFEGVIAFIGVVIDSSTRTYTVGAIPQANRDWLMPGMIIRATIHARLDDSGMVINPDETLSSAPLVIPETAPLITGKRAVVYLADPEENGVFEGREIELGPKAGDYYIVRSGLKEGDQVVVNGNFKIDSALQIRARPSMMESADGTNKPTE